MATAAASPDLARTAGVDVRHLKLLFLITFALTIAPGMRYLGVFPMGAVIIIAAATARRPGDNLHRNARRLPQLRCRQTPLSGSMLAAGFHRDSGPLIVLVAASVFLLSPVAGNPVVTSRNAFVRLRHR